MATVEINKDNFKQIYESNEIVIIDFWASWCKPCKKSFPYYDKLQKRLRDRGLVIVAVGVDETKAEAMRFLEGMAVDFAVVWDRDNRMTSDLDIKTMPTAFILDRKGVIRAVHRGFDAGTHSRIEADLEEVFESGK